MLKNSYVQGTSSLISDTLQPPKKQQHATISYMARGGSEVFGFEIRKHLGVWPHCLRWVFGGVSSSNWEAAVPLAPCWGLGAVSCLVPDNVCRQLPLNRAAETWARVRGKGERVRRLSWGVAWRWILSLLVLKVLRVAHGEEMAEAIRSWRTKNLCGWAEGSAPLLPRRSPPCAGLRRSCCRGMLGVNRGALFQVP